jgi:hypothetical protein
VQEEPAGVERLMRTAGLQGIRRGRQFITTKADPAVIRPADLVGYFLGAGTVPPFRGFSASTRAGAVQSRVTVGSIERAHHAAGALAYRRLAAALGVPVGDLLADQP